MPKTCNKLGYVCPVCGRDYGWDETVIQKSTRKRGAKNKRHVLSKRRTDEEKIHLIKTSLKPVESGLYNFVADLFEKLWLDVAKDGIEKLRRSGTWNRFPVQDQEYVLNETVKMKARIELRKKEEWEDEQKCRGWEIDLTEQDAPFYELSKKVVSLYQSQINEIDNNGIRVNPLLEIKKYRRHGDVLRHLYIDERDQVRVLWKYPSLIQRIKEKGKEVTIQKGMEFLRKYREPFSDARWRYTWIEQFWISICAHMISSRRAARMVGILDVSMSISPRYIKDRIETTIEFWQNFFQYVPRYLKYINLIRSVIKKDPVLSKIDQLDREKLDKEIEDDIGEIGIKHLRHLFQDSRSSSITSDGSYVNPQSNKSNKSNPDFDIHKMTRVSREMIRVRHPNLNYRREMEEFRNGLRKDKPKRKASSCYFDPWKQSDDVIAQLINKEKIHLVHKITRK